MYMYNCQSCPASPRATFPSQAALPKNLVIDEKWNDDAA